MFERVVAVGSKAPSDSIKHSLARRVKSISFKLLNTKGVKFCCLENTFSHVQFLIHAALMLGAHLKPTLLNSQRAQKIDGLQ